MNRFNPLPRHCGHFLVLNDNVELTHGTLTWIVHAFQMLGIVPGSNFFLELPSLSLFKSVVFH